MHPPDVHPPDLHPQDTHPLDVHPPDVLPSNLPLFLCASSDLAIPVILTNMLCLLVVTQPFSPFLELN